MLSKRFWEKYEITHRKERMNFRAVLSPLLSQRTSERCHQYSNYVNTVRVIPGDAAGLESWSSCYIQTLNLCICKNVLRFRTINSVEINCFDQLGFAGLGRCHKAQREGFAASGSAATVGKTQASFPFRSTVCPAGFFAFLEGPIQRPV